MTTASAKTRRPILFHAAAALVLAALILAVFAQVLAYDFVGYDDPETVTQNPYVTQGITGESVKWAFFSFEYFANWFPVTWLSHMADVEIYGLNPAGHHATNLALHLLNTLLLYALLYAMTGRSWESLIVAALFAIHPLHVEPVAWISERKGVLSTFFWLAASLAYVHYTSKPSLSRYLNVVVLLILGLLSKPMLVTLPFVFLLLDYWPLRRLRVAQSDDPFDPPERIDNPWRVHSLIGEKVPLLLIVAAMMVAALYTQTQGGALKTTDDYPLEVRVENALVSTVTYLEKTFVPRNLAVLYPHPGDTIPNSRVIGSAVLLLAVSVLALWQWRRRPYLLVGWFWFLGALVPVSQLIQLGGHGMADRYVYVPHIGLFIAVVWLASEAAQRARIPRPVPIAAAAIVIALLSVISWRQGAYWRDSDTLYGRAVAVTDGNRIAHNNLGRTLMDEGRVDEAMAHYEEALRIAPNYLTARMNYGNALIAQGRWHEALAQFQMAADANRGFAPVFTNLGNVLMRLGRLDEALVAFEHAAMIDGKAPETWNSLGACYYALGHYMKAREAFLNALQLDRNYTKARNNLAAAEAQLEAAR